MLSHSRIIPKENFHLRVMGHGAWTDFALLSYSHLKSMSNETQHHHYHHHQHHHHQHRCRRHHHQTCPPEPRHESCTPLLQCKRMSGVGLLWRAKLCIMTWGLFRSHSLSFILLSHPSHTSQSYFGMVQSDWCCINHLLFLETLISHTLPFCVANLFCHHGQFIPYAALKLPKNEVSPWHAAKPNWTTLLSDKTSPNQYLVLF